MRDLGYTPRLHDLKDLYGICKKISINVSGIASLTRDVMDCVNTFYYFAERGISKEEVDLRFDIAALHSKKKSCDMYDKLGFKEKGFRWIVDSEANVRFRVEDSDWYKNLSNEDNKKLSKGKMPKKEFITKKILDAKIESAFFNLLSQSVHSYNSGLGNSSPSTHLVMFGNYFDASKLWFVSYEISIIYVANAITDYIALIKRLSRYLTREEKNRVRELRSAKHLEE